MMNYLINLLRSNQILQLAYFSMVLSVFELLFYGSTAQDSILMLVGNEVHGESG